MISLSSIGFMLYTNIVVLRKYFLNRLNFDLFKSMQSELHRLAAQMERISPAISSVANTNLPRPAISSVNNNNTPHTNYPATLSFSSAFARNQQLINSLPQNDLSTRTSDSGVLRAGGVFSFISYFFRVEDTM